MAGTGLGLAERRSVVAAAREALAGLGEVLGQASDAELGELMGEVDAVTALGGAARAVVAAEAGMNAHGWVRECAPSLRQGGAGQVAKLAVEVASAGRAGGSLAPDASGEPEPGSPLGVVWAGVQEASVSPALGLAALGEVARLGPRVVPG